MAVTFPVISSQFTCSPAVASRAGFNAATLELPYHFQRRPRQYGRLSILCQYGPLISQDYLQMAKTYAQAVAEIRSLSGWLLAEGCPAVALAGVSLGGYLAGLTGCRDARLASIVMAIPAARMGLLLSQAEQVGGRRVREVMLRRRAAFEELDRTPLNLTLARPAISKENVLLIEGMHDLMVCGCPDRTLAVVGAARDLAIASRSYQHSLNRLNAGLAGPHPALANATAGPARRSNGSSAPLASGEHQRRKVII